MLKKLLSLLTFLILIFSLTFSVYPDSGDEPDLEGHPWNDTHGTIQPVPEEYVRLIFFWDFNLAPHFSLMIYKNHSQPSWQVQEMTKKQVTRGEKKISQNSKYLRKKLNENQS